MPKITQLPFITTGTTATSFLMVDEKATRRLRYDDLLDRVVDDLGDQIFFGPTGPAGPKGPTGPSGPSVFGVPAGGTVGQVLTKLSNDNYDTYWSTVSGGGGGGGGGGGAPTVGLSTRSLVTGTTSLIAASTTGTFAVAGYKSYLLQKVTTNVPAWVRIYSDGTSRTADVNNRHEGYDPLPGAGVIVEVITTAGNLTQLITPGVIGFNNETPVSPALYLAATNKSAVTTSVSVTLTLLQLEA